MKKCRAWQKRIPEAVYGELESKTRGELDRHLASCEKCSGLYRTLAKTVKQLAARPAPDREAEFWEGYWNGLERRMARETGGDESWEAAGAPGSALRPSRTFSVPRWAYGVAGAALFLSLGIFLGRTLFQPRPDAGRVTLTAASESSPAGRPGVESTEGELPLAARASRYLRRSRVILLAVVNSDPVAEDFFSLSLPLQKKNSEELVQEAALLKKELRGSDHRLERLVSDLEMILLQIANLKPQADASAVEVIKAGIESRDIFFKINLNEVRRSNGEGTGRAPTSVGLEPKAQNVKTAV